MTAVLYVGIALILISGIVNLIEIRKFIIALRLLNHCTITIMDKAKYPFRLFRIAFLLSPIGLDVIIIALGGLAGLGNGTLGFVLGLAASCTITLGVKIMYALFKPKQDISRDFNLEYAKLLRNE